MGRLSVIAPATPGPLRTSITDYLQDRRASGLSAKTVHIYRDAPEGVLLPFCVDVGVAELGQLTNRHLNDLNVGLLDGSRSRSGRPLSKDTVGSYMGAVNTFFEWARGEGEAVSAKAKLPRARKRVLDTLSRDEVQAMEDHAPTERDKIIVRVLADTGMRLSELLGLTVADVRVEHGRHVLKVHGKGDKERLVPITPGLWRRLKRFAEKGRPPTASERLFLSLRKSSAMSEYRAMTPSAVEQMIPVLADEAGITKRVYPHLFRHSFITDCLRRGMNPLLVAQIVGHESLAMINTVYQHLTFGDAHAELMKILIEG